MQYDFYDMAFGDGFTALFPDFVQIVGVGMGIGVIALLFGMVVRFVLDLFLDVV